MAEIHRAGFTADGMTRQASFKGLREDKPAQEVEAERPTPERSPRLASRWWARCTPERSRRVVRSPLSGVTLTHADKPLWPDAGDGKPVTKLDLARYCEVVGRWLLRHVQGRRCSVVRMPDGIDGHQKFFQRHTGQNRSPLISAVMVQGEREAYIEFDSGAALVAAAQAGAVEL